MTLLETLPWKEFQQDTCILMHTGRQWCAAQSPTTGSGESFFKSPEPILACWIELASTPHLTSTPLQRYERRKAILRTCLFKSVRDRDHRKNGIVVTQAGMIRQHPFLSSGTKSRDRWPRLGIVLGQLESAIEALPGVGGSASITHPPQASCMEPGSVLQPRPILFYKESVSVHQVVTF